jgi:transposase
MARPKEIIDSELAQQAEKQLKKFRNHRIYLRLLVISKAADHSITYLAKFFGISRYTINRWIHHFKMQGIAGLYDKPKGHNPSKLTDIHRQQITQWVNECRNAKGEPIHWTLEKLRITIQEEFGISISLMPLWRNLRLMGFRQKVPRPVHAKADLEAQQAFKKNG